MEPKLIKLKTYSDNRGVFYESHNSNLISNLDFNISQENTCISKKNVLRGIHYQTEPYQQAKLLNVVNGKILDICISLLPETYGKVYRFLISSNDNVLLYIPENYAHGYSILEDNTIVSYKTNKLYNQNSEQGIHPLSKKLNIDWLIKNPIISDKDLKLPQFI